MSKKHYIKAAKQISLIKDRELAHLVAYQFASFFEGLNDRFDRDRFLEACNVE